MLQSTIEILCNNPNAPEREEGEAAMLSQPKQHNEVKDIL